MNADIMKGKTGRNTSRVLWAQIFLLTLCGLAVLLLALRFPYPSPVVKPFLPPKLRWPSDQIAMWVDDGEFDRDFAHYFARDPARTIPTDAGMVSPADGIPSSTYFGGTTYFIVALSFWDVHVVRTPIAGTVTNVEMVGSYLEKMVQPDKQREIAMLQGKIAPVQAVVTMATPRGEVKIRLITSYWASRLKVWVRPGQKLAMGEKLGRILLGSTVIVEIPGKMDFTVQPGVHILGGASAIAEK